MNYFLLLLLTLATIKINAQVNDCLPPTAQTDLDINNVRATILNGGDMWHDLAYNFGYEVPKGSGKHSLFAGAIWVGGLDAGNQLKLAAQTYRQSGSDFYSGPINQISVTTTQSICNDYDKHWKITKQEVLDFINTGIATPSIIDWPGNGDPALNHAQFLAPFHDNNGDGIYNPADGDFPNYDFTGTQCQDVLLGDQTIWWVFNDVGNIHTESGGIPIGLEVHAMAYAYSSFDEAINNTTFYQYKLINRSSSILDSTYVAFWTDIFIGNFIDDVAASDVGLNLAFGYNGDSDDDGITGYGLNPPAVGVKILDGAMDVYGNLLGMSKFIFYYNNQSVMGNPSTPMHFYNYLRAIWKDGTPLTFGGSGYGGSTIVNYIFSNSTDPLNPYPWFDTGSGTNWNRRLVPSSGPFTFQPGEVQYLNTAVVWARTDTGGPVASVIKLKTAAATVQNYFDNCFFAVGINEPDLLSGIKLFPNPSLNGKFIISNVPPGSELSIYTMNGKLIEKKEIFSNSYESKMKVDKGVYLIKIKNKSAVKVFKWINLN